MDPTVRLRVATRIHFALLRHYDENVSVSTLLKGEDDAMEALWVCEASGHEELVTLAKQLNTAIEAERAASAKPLPVNQPTNTTRAATPQEMPWAQDTSGFGFSRLSEFGETPRPAAPAKPAHWMSPAKWFRRAVSR
jgi:hypothetical protein